MGVFTLTKVSSASQMPLSTPVEKKRFPSARLADDLLQTGFPWDGRGRVLVEGPEVPRELELPLDGEFLVAEDCVPASRSPVSDRAASQRCHLKQADLHTTPRSATSSALMITSDVSQREDLRCTSPL